MKDLPRFPHETEVEFYQRIKNFTDSGWQLLSKSAFSASLEEPLPIVTKAIDYCGIERPPRKVFCQLPKGHVGSHRAVVFWEDENSCAQPKKEGQ